MELKQSSLVTGGAGGIGGAVVRTLAKAGVAGVAINYRKSRRKRKLLPAEIEQGGSQSDRACKPTCRTTNKFGR